MQKPCESPKACTFRQDHSFMDEKNFCVEPVHNSCNDWHIRLEGSEVNEDVSTPAKFIIK